MSERLNKSLAQAGFGSRRGCDSLIESGRVTINGKKAVLGDKVEKTDVIALDGQIISAQSKPIVVLKFNKPRGIATTKKDNFEPVTVMDFLPPDYQHLNPVGRLDKLSRGLLLFTNDGELALKLTHPKYEHEKEYSVTFVTPTALSEKTVDQAMKRLGTETVDLTAQSKPIEIKDFEYSPETKQGHVTVILKEGRKRQIRRLFEAIGYFVTDLERTRMGNVKLDGLKPGMYAVLDPKSL